MNYLSVCSGIEAATQAWHPLGWQAVAYSEIEPFPCTVLAHHYPDTPNWGDMTKYKEWPDATVDVLAGGTPCQSFSVAGLRAGLADPRGNLMLTYLAIAGRYRPRWVVWENVPGVLFTDLAPGQTPVDTTHEMENGCQRGRHVQVIVKGLLKTFLKFRSQKRCFLVTGATAEPPQVAHKLFQPSERSAG